jgi:hypothetical protein
MRWILALFRTYNEMAVLKLVQSMTRVLANPPPVFQSEIRAHFQAHARPLIDRSVFLRSSHAPFFRLAECCPSELYCVLKENVVNPDTGPGTLFTGIPILEQDLPISCLKNIKISFVGQKRSLS